MKIKTPLSEISVLQTRGNDQYKNTFTIICHTNDTESLKKTLNYVVNKLIEIKEQK